MTRIASTARKNPQAPRGARATQTLVAAYRSVFMPGSADEAQKQVVLTDLANFTGFYRVTGPEMSSEARAFADGQRAAFGRLFRFLRMGEAEIRDLEEAAREEAITDAQYGEM